MNRKISYKLAAGLVLLAFFLFIALFGPHFAPYEPDDAKKIGYVQTAGGEEMRAAPFPPSKEHLFGTDKWGYDILTLLLHGAKYTVFTVIIVALFRVVAGGTAGMLFGLKIKKRKKEKPRITVLTSIPNFIIIYFIMVGINIEPSMPIILLIFIQCFLMAALGVPGVYDVVFAHTAVLRETQYVQAAETLGGSSWHLLKKHIFPALKGNFLILFVNETILVLHLIGQLGIFNLFLGGTEVQPYPTIYLSMTNEWSGLIGQSRAFLYHSQWIILFPLLAYMLLLFTFYLISSGLNDIHNSKIKKPSLL